DRGVLADNDVTTAEEAKRLAKWEVKIERKRRSVRSGISPFDRLAQIGGPKCVIPFGRGRGTCVTRPGLVILRNDLRQDLHGLISDDGTQGPVVAHKLLHFFAALPRPREPQLPRLIYLGCP